jgi:hypothetical protein
LPLTPPFAPALFVDEFTFVLPPLAVIVPKVEAVPLFPVAPDVAAVAAPPAPTEIEITFVGVRT